MVLRIVGELRDASADFRYRRDLYRLLFAHAPTKLETDEPDGYDHASRRSGYRTFGGQVVKSHGERLIADFLYLYGVEYEYERPYCVDFYYPGIDVWHEHWALDRDGNPPAQFEGYAASVAWKRDLHRRHGTQLLETTWGDVRGSGAGCSSTSTGRSTRRGNVASARTTSSTSRTCSCRRRTTSRPATSTAPSTW